MRKSAGFITEKKSPEARSAAGKKSRKRRISPKPKSSKSKRKRSKRSKFVYLSSPCSDTRETSSSDDESSSSSSSSDFEREKTSQSFRTGENGVSISPQVLDFAVSAVFRACRSPNEKTGQKRHQYLITLIYDQKNLIDLSKYISNARAFRSVPAWTDGS